MVDRFTGKAAALFIGIAASPVLAPSPAIEQDSDLVVRGPTRNLSDDYDLRIKRVPYRDLNLATQAGEQILYRRVGLAVRQVCLTAYNRSHGLSQSDHYRCTVGAWRASWPQMSQAITRARQTAYYRR